MRFQHSAAFGSTGLVFGLVASLLLFTHAASGAPEQAAAGIPNARGIFTGCYQTETGELRMIKGSLGCRPGERRVTWSRRGPLGPRGLQGATGVQGRCRSERRERSAGLSGITAGPAGPGGPQEKAREVRKGRWVRAGPAGPPGADRRTWRLDGRTPGPPGADGRRGLLDLQAPLVRLDLPVLRAAACGPCRAGRTPGPPGPAGTTGPAGPIGPGGPDGPSGPSGASRLSTGGPPVLRDRPGQSDSQVPAAASGTSAPELNAGQSYSLTKTCPAGKKILGGGYTYTISTANQTNRVAVDSYPSSGSAWTATVRVHQNLGGGVASSLSV